MSWLKKQLCWLRPHYNAATSIKNDTLKYEQGAEMYYINPHTHSLFRYYLFSLKKLICIEITVTFMKCIYVLSLKEVNTDILIIIWKLIYNLTTFMFSLCIFSIDIASCVEIIIVFQKFAVVECVIVVNNDNNTDFLPTPRRGSHVKSDKTHTQSSSLYTWHLRLDFQ